MAVFILFFFFNAMALYEFARMFKNQGYEIQTGSIILMGSAVYSLIGLYANSYLGSHILFGFVPLIFVFFISVLYQKTDRPFVILGIKVLSIIYIALPFGIFNIVENMGVIGSQENQPLFLVFFFILVWSSDTFAYLCGVSFGKHRLFERISPKKSWEGSIGGAICTMIIGYLIGYYSGIFTPLTWLSLALIIVITATYGDLVESLIKRQMKVKDSGSIMPGHGGILDRFDAAIFSIPFYLFLLYLLA